MSTETVENMYKYFAGKNVELAKSQCFWHRSKMGWSFQQCNIYAVFSQLKKLRLKNKQKDNKTCQANVILEKDKGKFENQCQELLAISLYM